MAASTKAMMGTPIPTPTDTGADSSLGEDFAFSSIATAAEVSEEGVATAAWGVEGGCVANGVASSDDEDVDEETLPLDFVVEEEISLCSKSNPLMSQASPAPST